MSVGSDAMPGGPGAEHALLHRVAGRWRSEVRLWMGPGEPHVSTGTMVNTMVLGGRFLRHDYTGDPSPGPFPAFAGEGFWGYNDVRQRWEGVWVDNASNQMMVDTGSYDPAARVWTMEGDALHPGMGEARRRSVITLVSDREHTMEMLFKSPGHDWQRGMVIRYTRA
jgi:hypothetical protein